MGGSGPVIDGGMTEEQYRKLQMEERQFQKQMEEEAFARAEEAEAKRMEMEQANVDRLRAQEDAEARAVQQSELSSRVRSIVSKTTMTTTWELLTFMAPCPRDRARPTPLTTGVIDE